MAIAQRPIIPPAAIADALPQKDREAVMKIIILGDLKANMGRYGEGGQTKDWKIFAI